MEISRIWIATSSRYSYSCLLTAISLLSEMRERLLPIKQRAEYVLRYSRNFLYRSYWRKYMIYYPCFHEDVVLQREKRRSNTNTLWMHSNSIWTPCPTSTHMQPAFYMKKPINDRNTNLHPTIPPNWISNSNTSPSCPLYTSPSQPLSLLTLITQIQINPGTTSTTQHPLPRPLAQQT